MTRWVLVRIQRLQKKEVLITLLTDNNSVQCIIYELVRDYRWFDSNLIFENENYELKF